MVDAVDDRLLDTLGAISDSWLRHKNTKEKGFSLGFFDKAYLRNCPLVLIKKTE
jgi:phosphatidylglycerol lysyltransferase